MLWTTARICVFTAAITLVLAYAVAYVLTHASPAAQRVMMIGVLLPLWMSVLVRAFAWVTLLRRQGLVNNALIGMVHCMPPLGILPMWSAMRGIDSRVLAAARGLLPLSLPGVIGSGLPVFISSLGFFITPAILGDGKTIMVAAYINHTVHESPRWGVGTMRAVVSA